MTEAAEATVGDSLGTGRRKTSVARVRIRRGEGRILINQRSLEDYFPLVKHRNDVTVALDKTGKRQEVDVIVRVAGGGATGQAGACKLGIARALMRYDAELSPALREHHLLTRDGRMKERKK